MNHHDHKFPLFLQKQFTSLNISATIIPIDDGVLVVENENKMPRIKYPK